MESFVKTNEIDWQTSSAQISVLLIAEVALVRLALRQLLSRAAEAVIVGEAGASQALGIVHQFLPDIALVDAHRIDETLTGFLRRLASSSAKTHGIVLSDSGSRTGAVRSADAGAWVYRRCLP